MEQLLILLLIGLGSLVSTYIQNKKKREAERRELDNQAAPPAPPGKPPVLGWPQTTRDWQEELRRMLQGEMAPPQPAKPPPIQHAPQPPPIKRAQVIVPKVIVEDEESEGDLKLPSPLKQSATAYARASELSNRVESRMEAVDKLTKAHQPTPVKLRIRPSGATVARRWTQNRQSLREAFIASLIFSPPVAMGDRNNTAPLA